MRLINLIIPQIVRAIIAMAMFEARKEIERNIQREGVIERREEFIAKAKASVVVQDEIQRLRAKEDRKRQRQLERNSKHLSNSERCGSRGLSLNECHAQNGATR